MFTLATPSLMLTLINTAYFGITQFFPGVMAIIFFRRVDPKAIIAGIVCADILAIALNTTGTHLGGWNIGFVCLLVNVAIITAGTFLGRREYKSNPVVRQALAIRDR